MPDQPNVLFIITDQQRADHVGFAGNQVVRTPHLDALAARGMVFDNAWVANPICMPNRSTIMTGRMPTAHGVIFNDRSLGLGGQHPRAALPAGRLSHRAVRQVAPPARHEPQLGGAGRHRGRHRRPPPARVGHPGGLRALPRPAAGRSPSRSTASTTSSWPSTTARGSPVTTSTGPSTGAVATRTWWCPTTRPHRPASGRTPGGRSTRRPTTRSCTPPRSWPTAPRPSSTRPRRPASRGWPGPRSPTPITRCARPASGSTATTRPTWCSRPPSTTP